MNMDDVQRAVLTERLDDWHNGFVRAYATAEAFERALLKSGQLDDIELLEEDISAVVKSRWLAAQGK